MKLNNLKLGLRLSLAFGLVLTLLAVLIAMGLSGMSKINDTLNIITDSTNVKLEATMDMRDAQRRIAIAVRNVILMKEDTPEKQKELIEKYLKNINLAKEDYEKNATTLKNLVKSEKGKT